MSTALATLGDFRDTFPEFAGVVDGLITRALNDASDRIAVGVYRNQTTRAHCLLAAHVLVVSPWGQNARLSGKNQPAGAPPGQTTYSLALRELQRERAAFIGCT